MINEERSLPTKIAEGVGETLQWFLSLDPSFAFLFSLPLLVGLAGLFSEYLRQRRGA